MIKLVMIALSMAVYDANIEGEKHRVTGPFFKNQHVSGKYQSELTLYKMRTADFKGPEYKNVSIAEKKETATLSKITIGKRKSLKGPMAKNRKPWRK